MKLVPITKSRLSEAAIEQIKELILSNKLKPGSKLPPERELVKQLKISRASVREALRMLEIMGLVEAKPGKGTYINELPGDLFVPLPKFLSSHKESLHNHFEARLVLEPAAAGFAALRANSSHIKKLTGALSNFEESLGEGNLVGMIRSDIHFHALIGVATGNKTIQLLMGTITKYLFEGWKATLRVKGRPQKTVLEHGKILEAIVERNEGKARQAMQRHLRNAVQDLKAHGLG